MKWIKRLLVLIVSVIFGSALLVTGAVVLLSDDEYKQLLSWGAEQFLDSTLVISGPINLDISKNITLESGNISLKANNGSYTLSIGSLHGSFRLGSYLRTGTFWINSLALEDVTIQVVESEGNESEFDLENISIPPVIIGSAQIRNLVFIYQELHPGSQHTFSLDDLKIGELGKHQQVSLRASGQIEGQPFELQGNTDSVSKLLEQDKPLHVTLEFNSDLIVVSADGTIEDPLAGTGLNLQAHVEISQVKNVLEIFLDDVPNLGELTASVNVHGDYDSPRLENINLTLHQAEDVNLEITGSIQNVIEVEGIDVQFDGKSDNPNVLTWLLFNEYDQMQSIQFSGGLQNGTEQFEFNNVNATAKTTKGLEIVLVGSVAVHPKAHRITRQDAELNVQFKAPSVAAMNIINMEGIPELGAVSGSLSLALGMDAVGIYNSKLNIGSRKQTHIELQGNVGYVQFKDEYNLPELTMQSDVHTADLKKLGKLLEYDLPDFGPAQLQGKLVSHGSELQLHNTILDVGAKEKAYMHATGGLSFQLHEPTRYSITMYVEVDAQDFAQLGEPFDIALPNFGKTQITGWLEVTESQLEFKDARLAAGDAKSPTLRANARVVTDMKEGSDISIDFDVGIADLIAAYTDLDTRDLGLLHGDLILSDIDGDWGLESFSFVSTRTELFQFSIDGSYDDLLHYDQASINSNIAVKHPQKLAEALDINLGNIGALGMQGELTLTKKRLQYIGSTKIGETTSTTDISGIYVNGKPNLNGSINMPILYLTDLGFGAERNYSSNKLQETKQSSPYVFSRDEINVDFLNEFDIDLDINIDQVESGDLTIDSITGKLNVKDGHLKLKPFHLIFEGGNTDINLDIKAEEVPKYELTFNANDLTLGPLISQVQNEVPMTGYTNIDLNLTSQGRSAHEMASGLDGDVSIGFENIRIPQKYVSLLSVDTLGWAMSSVGIGTHAALNCVVMSFGADNGEVKSKAIVADGPRMSLGGKIDMNLGEETLDIILIPSQKKRIFSKATPVKIHGPMKNPKIEAIPAKAALREVAGFTLLSTGVFIPIAIVSKTWSVLSDGDKTGGGCENVKEMSEKAQKEVQKLE